MKKILLIVIFALEFTSLKATQIKTDVLVVGGSASGITAAIQAARDGVDVVVVEQTTWLGGMLTAAGVSCTDGNHRLPSGLWGEFRERLYDYYGSPESVCTGWVSNTLFEPSVGNKIFNDMANEQNRLLHIHGFHIVKALVEEGSVKGAVFVDEKGLDTLTIRAKLCVDASELGDMMAMSGCNYFVGQDPKSRTHEKGAPEKATDIIQDLTYVAILKDYGKGADKTIEKPDDYDPSLFDCTCNDVCSDPNDKQFTCQRMLEYGKLPNGKFMINWPKRGNDYYLNSLEMNFEQRREAYVKAKNLTLGWVYFIQTKLGWKHLGLADDEFPTKDKLALYPYYRESRRLDGVVQLRNMDLVDPYLTPNGDYYKTAISVGDYPLDLHHKKMPVKIQYDIVPVPSFSVPLGCLIPKKVKGLIVAEKSISVSHIVNGCTRLQPSVLGIGQAAGAMAAICVKENVQPVNVDIRKLQQVLLDSQCWLMPFLDLKPGDPYFQSVQRIGLSGVMRGEGIVINWSNETWFYPENSVAASELQNALNIVTGKENQPLSVEVIAKEKKRVSRQHAALVIWKALGSPRVGNKSVNFDDVKNRSSLQRALQFFESKGVYFSDSQRFNPSEDLKRKDLAMWLDKLFDPFHNLEVRMVPKKRI